MRLGRLTIPEGVPLLINVNDDSWCRVAVRLLALLLSGAQQCSAVLLLRLAVPGTACMRCISWRWFERACGCAMVQEDGTSDCKSPLFSIFKSK